MDAQIERVIAGVFAKWYPVQSGYQLESSLRELAQRVLEIARDRSCGWCAKGSPVLSHNGSDWHPKTDLSRVPRQLCTHDRLDEDGYCRKCSADCRTGTPVSAPEKGAT